MAAKMTVLTAQGLYTEIVPPAQSFSLANNGYQGILQWTVTGQTDDPLPSFGVIAGSQTYGSSPPIQGPAFWFGYNPALLSASVPNSSHGAAGLSCFGDAGDSSNGAGGHGLEMNPACFITPNGALATNALQMVAIDDNTNTVNLYLRCGTGSVNGVQSGITIQKSDASVTYMRIGPIVSDGVYIYQPVGMFSGVFSGSALSQVFALAATAGSNQLVFTAAGSGNFTSLSMSSAASTVTLTMNSNATSGQGSTVKFQHNSLATWTLEEYSSIYFYVLNNSGNAHILLTTGNNLSVYDNALTQFFTKTQVLGSMVVGPGSALATTATTGFLYLPTCAGAPTGTPVANTGSAPVVFDTTNNKIWVYNGGWKGVVVS